MYASACAILSFASCELSDDYQPGIDRIQQIFNPAFGWMAMLVISACFWRVWAIRQLEYGLWILGFSCCLSYLLLLVNSSESNYFPPAGRHEETLMRSIFQPSLSTGSFIALAVFGLVIANTLIAVGWFRLFVTGHSKRAWQGAQIFALAWGMPLLLLVAGFALVTKEFLAALSTGLTFGFVGAPVVYLATCAAMYKPLAGIPIMIVGTLLPFLPLLLLLPSKMHFHFLLCAPVLLICATASASFIDVKAITTHAVK